MDGLCSPDLTCTAPCSRCQRAAVPPSAGWRSGSASAPRRLPLSPSAPAPGHAPVAVAMRLQPRPLLIPPFLQLVTSWRHQTAQCKPRIHTVTHASTSYMHMKNIRMGAEWHKCFSFIAPSSHIGVIGLRKMTSISVKTPDQCFRQELIKPISAKNRKKTLRPYKSTTEKELHCGQNALL